MMLNPTAPNISKSNGLSFESSPIESLRQSMRDHRIDAYYIPTADYHRSEMVEPHFQIRHWITGFTGSYGDLLVLENDAYLWTDGRYFLQAANELEGSGITLMRMGVENVPTLLEFLQTAMQNHAIHSIGFDGRLIPSYTGSLLENMCNDYSITMDGNLDLIKDIWLNRPHMSNNKIYPLSPEITGEDASQKVDRVRKMMLLTTVDDSAEIEPALSEGILKNMLNDKSYDKNIKVSDHNYPVQHDCIYLVSALDDIAWLLNMRGADFQDSPLFYSYLLLGNDFITIYVQTPESFPQPIYNYGNSPLSITVKNYSQIYEDLRNISDEISVITDLNNTSYSLIKALSVNQIRNTDIIASMKSAKNPTEIQGFRQSHVLDGVALIKFLCYVDNLCQKYRSSNCDLPTEWNLAEQLKLYRMEADEYKGQSFSPIIAAGKNASVVHYSPSPDLSSKVEIGSFLLCDTGGQYSCGTTDVTRTIAIGKLSNHKLKTVYTWVLKAHLALARMIFERDTPAYRLDTAVRKVMSASGQNYNHGTGHGVGHMLNVHEGPVNINSTNSLPLNIGNIVSNEPGTYIAGEFGVRIENLMAVVPVDEKTLGFETLTLCPYDKTAIDMTLLTEDEISQINRYHRKVLLSLSPYLLDNQPVADWLEDACAPI